METIEVTRHQIQVHEGMEALCSRIRCGAPDRIQTGVRLEIGSLLVATSRLLGELDLLVAQLQAENCHLKQDLNANKGQVALQATQPQSLENDTELRRRVAALVAVICLKVEAA